MKDTETKKVSGRSLAGSICVFTLCYLILIAYFLIVLVIRHKSDWTLFVAENLNAYLSFCVSSFLLYAVVYYYYYFEDRNFLGKAKNVLLIFSVFTVTMIINSLIGIYVNIYMRPTAMLALLFVFLFNRLRPRERALLVAADELRLRHVCDFFGEQRENAGRRYLNGGDHFRAHAARRVRAEACQLL